MISILNIQNVRVEPLSELLQFCNERVAKREGATLVPLNPIKVIKARNQPTFQKMIDEADWVFADAWGIQWAARLLHRQTIEICPGWQTMLALMKQAEENGHGVYLLGTTDEILEQSKQELANRFPSLRIVGMHHGFFPTDEERPLIDSIVRLAPDYIFVAMGEQRQEIVIEKIRQRHPSAVYQGVGGSLDLIAGYQPLPPKWMRDRHLEWLFRAIRQPFRLPRFRALPIFAALVIACRFSQRQT